LEDSLRQELHEASDGLAKANDLLKQQQADAPSKSAMDLLEQQAKEQSELVGELKAKVAQLQMSLDRSEAESEDAKQRANEAEEQSNSLREETDRATKRAELAAQRTREVDATLGQTQEQLREANAIKDSLD